MNECWREAFVAVYPRLFKHAYLDIGYGWLPLVEKVCLVAKDDPEFYFTQIKEKFGTLRVYATKHLDIIDEVERESASICEVCGSPGRLRDEGWMKTRCDNCK